jgi:small-conductance mechanosensitive channel
LEQAKQTIEAELAAKNKQLSTLSERILEINNNLEIEIGHIDTIMNELDTNSTDVDQQFTLIQNNIDAITKIINGSNSVNPMDRNIYKQQVNPPNPLQPSNYRVPRDRDKFMGGKRKTQKRRYKRTHKRALKGGYVYNSSSKLDKASAVILTSSKDKSVKKKSKRQKT